MKKFISSIFLIIMSVLLCVASLSGCAKPNNEDSGKGPSGEGTQEEPSGEETQDIPTSAPEPRQRRTMVIPDFEQTYMTRHDIHVRSALYVSIDTKRKVLDVVKKIGSEYMTATSCVENIVRQHLELYKDDINRIYKQKSTQSLI